MVGRVHTWEMEMAVDGMMAASGGDWRMLERGVPLADYEDDDLVGTLMARVGETVRGGELTQGGSEMSQGGSQSGRGRRDGAGPIVGSQVEEGSVS